MQTQSHHNNQCKNKEIKKTFVKGIVFNVSGKTFRKKQQNQLAVSATKLQRAI